MNTDFDFEGQWQHKLGEAVAHRVSDPAREFVLEAGSALNDRNSALEKLVWTCGMLERLEEGSDLITRQEILADCHCSYPLEDLLNIKMTYRVSGDIDQVLFMLQAKFESFLRKDLALEEDLVEFIVKNGWGLAGYRDGNRIIATKIPKSGYLREYFKEDDPEKKRKLYCHCPRVRDEVGSEPGLPMEYCYCGAGFYKGIWEEILGEPVEVEIIDSVMQGDDTCTVAVHLPDKT